MPATRASPEAGRERRTRRRTDHRRFVPSQQCRCRAPQRRAHHGLEDQSVEHRDVRRRWIRIGGRTEPFVSAVKREKERTPAATLSPPIWMLSEPFRNQDRVPPRPARSVSPPSRIPLELSMSSSVRERRAASARRAGSRGSRSPPRTLWIPPGGRDALTRIRLDIPAESASTTVGGRIGLLNRREVLKLTTPSPTVKVVHFVRQAADPRPAIRGARHHVVLASSTSPRRVEVRSPVRRHAAVAARRSNGTTLGRARSKGYHPVVARATVPAEHRDHGGSRDLPSSSGLGRSSISLEVRAMV